MKLRILLIGIAISLTSPWVAGESAVIDVHLDDPLGAIDPLIYGHFTELTLTSFEGGIWSELLFNRKFMDRQESEVLVAPRTGTGEGWEPISSEVNVILHLDKVENFSPPYSQRITITKGKKVVAGIQQGGFTVVMPHIERAQRISNPFTFSEGQVYSVRVTAKGREYPGPIHVALGESVDDIVAEHQISPVSDEWGVHEFTLIPSKTIADGKLIIYIEEPGTVWVDSVSMTREDLTENGFRKDAIELSKRMNATNYRWPGGCFVDDYHWKDGIGPMDERPVRYNRAWKAYLTNDVGTDEFMEMCRMIGAEPYICVNFGTATPQEAAEWVEYCNGSADTKWGAVRAENGHPEPYDVKYWNIGNETYLRTEIGGTNGWEYGRGYREFAKAMRAADPSIELVANGTTFQVDEATMRKLPSQMWDFLRYNVGWTEGLFTEAGDLIDHLSLHYYQPGDLKQAKSADQAAYHGMTTGEDLGAKVSRVQEQMKKFSPTGKVVPIALDEWSLRVEGGPEHPTDRPVAAGITSPETTGLYGNGLALRDALFEATVFNLKHRRPGEFSLGSRTLAFAYMIGIVGIGRDNAIMSPPGLMMELYSTHEKCQSLRTEVTSPTFHLDPVKPGWGARGDIPSLDVSARVFPDGKTVQVFVVNRDLNNEIEGRVEIKERGIDNDVEVDVLTASDPMQWNTFAQPENVKIESHRIAGDGAGITYKFPAHSITRFTVNVS